MTERSTSWAAITSASARAARSPRSSPLTGLLIANLNDASLVFSPSLEYNATENIYLGAGAYVRVGRCPVLLPTMSPLPTRALRSEFGTYPDVVYVSFRVYF